MNSLAQDDKGWVVTRYHIPGEPKLALIDYWPSGDLKEHWLGDECWCKPNTVYKDGVPIIMHHSQDLREKPEAPRIF